MLLMARTKCTWEAAALQLVKAHAVRPCPNPKYCSARSEDLTEILENESQRLLVKLIEPEMHLMHNSATEATQKWLVSLAAEKAAKTDESALHVQLEAPGLKNPKKDAELAAERMRLLDSQIGMKK